MSLTLKDIHRRIPEDHCRQVSAEDYIKSSKAEKVRFLDVGAGDGRSFDVAKKRLGETVDWTGIDIEESPEVRSRKRTDCHFVSFDGINIPYEDNTFDFVYSRQVFEHVRHPEPLLREIRRVLKPGGVFAGSVSQLEPFHSFSVWNFTYYGFAVICSDAGLMLDELRPGVDGFTLCARNAMLFWLGQAIPAMFASAFTSEGSLFNKYVESIDKFNNRNIRTININKITYCGHLCFKFSKPNEMVAETDVDAPTATTKGVTAPSPTSIHQNS